MSRTKNNLLSFAERQPNDPVTELIDVPAGLLEALLLIEKAEKGDASLLPKGRILIESIVNVILSDAESILNLKALVESGYRLQFSPDKNQLEVVGITPVI